MIIIVRIFNSDDTFAGDIKDIDDNKDENDLGEDYYGNKSEQLS